MRILFHHLMSQQGDAYLLRSLLAFDSRQRLDRYLCAVQAVIDRHDILRSAIHWERLPEPVQVVWRQAPLQAEEVQLSDGDAASELRERFAARHYRLDVRCAPLQRAFFGFDRQGDRWLLLLLSHHLAVDHTTLQVIFGEVHSHLLGEGNALPEPVPFRDFVARSRDGLSRAQHEEFFREMLGEVHEPTAPFGLLDVLGEGREISETRHLLPDDLSRALRACARAAATGLGSVFHLA